MACLLHLRLWLTHLLATKFPLHEPLDYSCIVVDSGAHSWGICSVFLGTNPFLYPHREVSVHSSVLSACWPSVGGGGGAPRLPAQPLQKPSGWVCRSPSSALLPFFRGGFPSNRLQKKSWYPYSNLSTGEPRCAGMAWCGVGWIVLRQEVEAPDLFLSFDWHTHGTPWPPAALLPCFLLNRGGTPP